MALTLSSAFIAGKSGLGLEPIWLVEISTLGIFLSTREPEFTGNWKAGDGLIAGSPIKAGDPYPIFQNLLTQLSSGGIGAMTYAQDSLGFSRTGNSSFEVLNQGLFSDVFLTPTTEGTTARIRLGFAGMELDEYLVVFKGVIGEMDATLETMTFELIDDTLALLEPTPPQVGARLFPRSFEKSRSIPIALGEAESIPSIKLIDDVTATLAVPLSIGANELFVEGTRHPFPPSGSLTIGAETLDYGSITEISVSGIPSLRFNSLVRTAPLNFSKGKLVSLVNFKYTSILAFDDDQHSRLRSGPTGTPTGPQTVRTIPVSTDGSDPRLVAIVERDVDSADPMHSDISGGVGPNLIPVGGGTQLEIDQWTLINGNFIPTTDSDPQFEGIVNIGQLVQTELIYDFPIETNTEYYLKAVARVSGTAISDPPFWSIIVGTPASPGEFFATGDRENSVEEYVTGMFTTNDTDLVARITLIVDNGNSGNGAPGSALFDAIRVRKLERLNPGTLIQHLIDKYIPTIKPHAPSFADATTRFAQLSDRLQGALVDPEEAQAVLGRIAYQFRCKTHLGEDGEQRLVLFDNQRDPTARITVFDIDKGSMHVELAPEESVYSQFYVYYDRDYGSSGGGTLGGRESYRSQSTANPSGSTSEQGGLLVPLCKFAAETLKSTQALEVFADFIQDAATANRLMEHLVRYHTYRKVLASFTTWIHRIDLEIGDFIFLDHDVLPDFASNNTRYEVTGKEIQPNGFTVSYTCQEVRQSQYGGWIERWEPLAVLSVSTVIVEQWTLPPDPQLAFLDKDGNVNACNPFIETWGTGFTVFGEDFSTLVSEDDLGLEPILLTQHLAYITEWDEGLGNDHFGTHLLGIPNVSAGTLAPKYQVTTESSLLPTGGPGGTVAISIPGVTGTKSFLPIWDTSRIINFKDTDVTISTWVRIRADTGVIQIIAANRAAAPQQQVPTQTTHIPYAVWYDSLDQQFKASYDVSHSANITNNAAVLRSALESNQVIASNFGAVTKNVWNMVTLRFDFSALTFSVSVNGGAENVLVVTRGLNTYGLFPSDDFLFPEYVSIGGASSLGDITGSYGLIDQASGTGPNLAGDLGQYAVWGRLLDGAELTQLYNSGNSLPYPFV